MNLEQLLSRHSINWKNVISGIGPVSYTNDSDGDASRGKSFTFFSLDVISLNEFRIRKKSKTNKHSYMKKVFPPTAQFVLIRMY